MITLPTLFPLDASNQNEIEKLLDAAFGTDRRGRTAYLLRAGASQIETMSFGLIADNDALVGSIQCWPILITADDDGEQFPMVLVGPVAVAPGWQNQGLGHILMTAALNASTIEGNPPLVMIGDPDYYRRFGFSADDTGGWNLPGPWEAHRLLLRNEGEYQLPVAGQLSADCKD
jgi:predicted N-acetyltransferase YhbS